jgi:hypothetical protein
MVGGGNANDFQQVYQVISNGQAPQFGLMLPSIQNFFPSYIVDNQNTDLQ